MIRATLESPSLIMSVMSDAMHEEIPCIPMYILSTLSALNSIENTNITEFRMDSMHIGTRA